MSLKEDLQTLSDTVPLLNKSLADALHGAEALETAAQELQHEVDAARDEATQELATLQGALPRLAVQVEAEEKALADAEAAVSDGWQNTSQELEKDGEQVANRVDEVVGEVHDLQAVLVEAATRIDQSQATGEAALSRLQHDAQEAGQRLHAAFEALNAEVSGFHGFAESAKQQLSAATTRLWSRLQGISSEAADGAQQSLEAFRAKTGAYKDAAHGVVAALSQQIMDKVDAAGAQVDHELTAPVGGAVAGLHDELGRLEAAAGKHELALANHGTALDAALEQAKAEDGPVRAGIGQIQEAARKAGVT
ncbi:MAG TPA: hypothetical protein VEQ10_04970 [Vicinamibacteria bacterium]|nr:hypothetical protein [Vicinamibacteria bacterium]